MGKRSAIVITVENSAEVSILCTKRLRFARAPKVVEKYQEAKQGLVYINYTEIGYDCLEEYRNRGLYCVICTRDNKTKNHLYKVIGCNVKKGKICMHVTPKYANCEEHHQATAFKYLARLKTQMQAWREKSQSKAMEPTSPITALKEELEVRSSEIEVDFLLMLQPKNLEQ